MRIIIWGHKAPSCLRHDRQVRGQGKEALIYALIKAYRHIYTLRVYSRDPWSLSPPKAGQGVLRTTSVRGTGMGLTTQTHFWRKVNYR